MTPFDDGNPGPCLRQTQRCDSVKPVLWDPTPPPGLNLFCGIPPLPQGLTCSVGSYPSPSVKPVLWDPTPPPGFNLFCGIPPLPLLIYLYSYCLLFGRLVYVLSRRVWFYQQIVDVHVKINLPV